MKLIITGATGFIGRNFVEHFLNLGMEVLATGRSQGSGQALCQLGADFRPADITDHEQIKAVFSPADCVIHCAAHAGDWGGYQEFYKANVLGSQNVGAACLHHGIKKLIYISTPSIYFTGKDRRGIKESDPLPLKQKTHYSRTKLMAEEELLGLQGLKVISFRPRAVYGPHDNTIIPRVLKMAEKKRFPLINNGEALADITYVGNLSIAVNLALAASPSAWNQAYNISNNDPITVKEWFSLILKIYNKPFRPKNIPEPMAKALAMVMELVCKKPSMTRFSVGYMAKDMTLSNEKAKEKLGYEPLITNQEGFEKVAAWALT